MTPDEIRDQVRTMREAAGAAPLARDVVHAEGEAAVDYLQGQLSQDVAALAVGSSAWTFVLQPQGKVDVWFRITRIGDAAFVLDCDPGWGEALLARLERFRLRTAVTFTPREWSGVAIRGREATRPDGGLVVAVDRPGERGWDVLGPDVAVPAGLAPCSPAALEVLRIESGTPRMGAELDESTIPAEAGVVPASVSFTKGCYTGQELVARIDSRGSTTPRRLVGVLLDDERVPATGAALNLGGDAVGTITSATAGGTHGGAVALAYLKRGVESPAPIVVDGVEAPIRDLPLVGS
ncbi:CAF17-like 4Fe-4S cluster assembly/insertion protein YgfZ [Actinomarinicola tropica]|uniref:Aminomethyltransferase C-terminal domain-containing protein n=1 Tax=Actinomarinicola tropica TaxID=2789776 RepID=A0A5Q2RJ07_9ACTN|nr:glycine cleavage T C-terminal barrel domain-containing protein [Actinomarinicola tropica]QGG95504.1 hypothetical protein GH723_10570 [Actinomarinicola tropica]